VSELLQKHVLLAESWLKNMLWLKCYERKTLFQLKKEAEQTEYGISRTSRIVYYDITKSGSQSLFCLRSVERIGLKLLTLAAIL